MTSRTILYSSLGPVLEIFEVDPASGALALRQSLTMPARVQHGWFNAARTILYLAVSDAGPAGPGLARAQNHFVQALAIAPNGTLTEHGPPLPLAHRPLYVTLDPAERHLLLAYNSPSGVTVHAIAPDGTIGAHILQPPLEFGVTVHQVRVTPPGTLVIVPAVGHHPTGETPGQLDIFSFEDGRLSPHSRMVPDPARAAPWKGFRHGGQGFAARHVTFHPTRPWMYLCVETQGELRLHDYDAHAVALAPRAIVSTLDGAQLGRSTQMASHLQIHPNGRTLYIGNRAWDAETVDGQQVYVGGVNDIAVFALDQATGEPALIQHIDTHGIFPRTFGLNAEGTLLVVGNEEPRLARGADGELTRILPSLVVYRIADDGRLTLLARHDHPDNGQICFWVDVISLPA